jgi:hypothetical protein
MYEASLAFWIDYFSSLRIYSLVWELLSAGTLNVISLASALWVMISSWAVDLRHSLQSLQYFPSTLLTAIPILVLP